MNATVSEDLLEAAVELREIFPDWRFGQLVANLVTAGGVVDVAAIWDVDDEALLAAARRLSERNRGRQAME